MSTKSVNRKEIKVSYITYDAPNEKMLTRKEMYELGAAQGKIANVNANQVVLDTVEKFGPDFRLGKQENILEMTKTINKLGIEVVQGDDRQGNPPLIRHVTFSETDEIAELLKAVNESEQGLNSEAPLYGVIDGKVVPVGKLTTEDTTKEWGADPVTLEFDYHIPQLPYTGSNVRYPKSLLIPKYTPRVLVGTYDRSLISIIIKVMDTGKIPMITDGSKNDATQFMKLYNEFKHIHDTHYFGSGNYTMQLQRKVRVDKIAATIGPIGMDQQEYDNLMNEYYPLNPVKMDFHQRMADLFNQATEKVGHNIYKTTYSSDTGPLSLDNNGTMRKNGVWIEQNDILSDYLLQQIEAKAQYESYSFFGLAALKPKEEVYPKDKGYVRNIVVYNSSAMRPAHIFIKTASVGAPEWGENGCLTISGNTLLKGGMDNLIKKMREKAHETGEEQFAMYSDNLTIVGVEGKRTYLASLDGEKFEAHCTPETIRYEMNRIIKAHKEVGSNVPPYWETYLTEIMPYWIARPTAVLGNQQFVLNQMGSGAVDTFRWNNCNMARLVHHIRKNKVRVMSPEGQLTQEFEKLLKEKTFHMTLESYVPDIDIKTTEPLNVDLLGFDAVRVGDTYIPVLQRKRLLKMLLFPKSKAVHEDKNTMSKWIVNYSRMVSAYILGGWFDQYIGFVIRSRVRGLLQEIRSAIRKAVETGGKETEQIAIIKRILTDEFSSDDTEDAFFSLISSLVSKRVALPTLYDLYVLLVGNHDVDEFVRMNLAAGVSPADVVPQELYEKYGLHDVKSRKYLEVPDKVELVPKTTMLGSITQLLGAKPTNIYGHRVAVKVPKQTTAVQMPKKKITKDDPQKLMLFERTMSRLKNSKAQLNLLVPTPQLLRGKPIKEGAENQLAWNRLFIDLQSLFHVTRDTIMKHYGTLGRVFRPTLLVPPSGYQTIEFKEFLTKREGEYQLNYLGYTNTLYIKDGTALEPKIDYPFYQIYGISKGQVDESIIGNREMDLDFSSKSVKSRDMQAKLRPIAPQYITGHEPSEAINARQAKKVAKQQRVEKAIQRQNNPQPKKKSTKKKIVMEKKEPVEKVTHDQLVNMVRTILNRWFRLGDQPLLELLYSDISSAKAVPLLWVLEEERPKVFNSLRSIKHKNQVRQELRRYYADFDFNMRKYRGELLKHRESIVRSELPAIKKQIALEMKTKMAKQ